MGFHYSLLDYLKEKTSQSFDVTDKLKLAIKSKDDNQPIIDSKDKKVRKRLDRVAKTKTRYNSLYAPIRQALIGGSTASPLSYLLMPALLSHLPMLTLLSHPFVSVLLFSPMPILLCLPVPALLSPFISISSRSPIPALSSPSMPALSCLLIPTLLSSLVPALLSRPVPALLSTFISTLLSRSMFSPNLTYFTSSTLRIFKQALSNKLLRHYLTSPNPTKLFCPFSTLGPLPKKNNRKWPFDTTFINSCLLTKNHAAKEVDLSFGECRCSALVKLNWS